MEQTSSKEGMELETLEYLKLDYDDCVKRGITDLNDGGTYENVAGQIAHVEAMMNTLFEMFDKPEGINLLQMKSIYYLTVCALHTWLSMYVDGANPDVLDDPNVICEKEKRVRELVKKASDDAAARIGKSGKDGELANFVYVRDAYMLADELGLVPA